MTEQQFKEKLHKEGLTEDEKIELCQWYIDNYPVPVRRLMGRIYSKLEGISIIPGGNPELMQYAIIKLQEYFKK